MATIITNECINCGACEAECPNTAIYQGGVEWQFNGASHPALAADTFYIVAEKCTECVGFFDREACAAVCPVDCCIPDPERPETETLLLGRARQLHPDQTFGADAPSRFRVDGAAEKPAAPAAAAEPPPAPPSEPKPAAAPASPPPAEAKEPDAPAAAPPAAAPVPSAPTPSGPAVAPAPSAPAASAPAPPAEKKPAAPAAIAPATPAARPASAPTAEAESPAAEPAATEEKGPKVPAIGEFEVPLQCFTCDAEFVVRFKHFRTGAVLRCPRCRESYVVSTSIYGHVNRALQAFHAAWKNQFDSCRAQGQEALEALDARERSELARVSAELRTSCHQLRPPGVPRLPAGLFG